MYQNGQFASLNAGSDCKKFDFLLFLPQKFAYIKKKQYLCTNKSHHASRRKTSGPGWDVSFNMEYTKQPITLAEQINILKQRGLIFEDEQQAIAVGGRMNRCGNR